MENGIEKAYNQHFEVPKSVNAETMKRKVIIMLCVGIIFLLASALAFIVKDAKMVISLTFGAYLCYVIGEALYYRTHTKAYALVVLIAVLTALSIFVA